MEISKNTNQKVERYFEAVGRRKTATARVRLFVIDSSVNGAENLIEVNQKNYKDYFKPEPLRNKITEPLKLASLPTSVRLTVKVSGSGPASQAEAVRHGISRALVKLDTNLKSRLSNAGFMTRDPRMVERKKFGLKKARRAPQWSKR